MLLGIIFSIWNTVREDKNAYTTNENTINERMKTDIGTGVQMSKYLNHKSPASQGYKKRSWRQGIYGKCPAQFM